MLHKPSVKKIASLKAVCMGMSSCKLFHGLVEIL